jgi:hypothetical protein
MSAGAGKRTGAKPSQDDSLSEQIRREVQALLGPLEDKMSAELKTRDETIANLKKQIEDLTKTTEPWGPALDQCQKDVMALQVFMDTDEDRQTARSLKVTSLAAEVAEAKRNINTLGGRITDLKVEDKIEQALQPVASRVTSAEKKLSGSEGEAVRALKSITELEEARVARECAENVVVFDCGAVEGGREGAMTYAKKVLADVGAVADVKATKTFVTTRRLGNTATKVTNMVITLGSQAQVSSLLAKAGKERARRRTAARDAAQAAAGGQQGAEADRAAVGASIPAMKYDVSLQMRERLRQATQQKYAMVADRQYAAKNVWWHVVDGIPRLFTREDTQGGRDGYQHEWTWNKDDRKFTKEERQRGGQRRPPSGGPAGPGEGRPADQ